MGNVAVAGKVHKWLLKNRDKRHLFLRGGGSSAKSWTVAFDLVTRWVQEKNIGILALRKTRPAVKKSCWVLLHHWLKEMELPCFVNKSDLIIKAKHADNFIRCDAFENIFKMRSIEGINYIWIEEAAAIGHDASVTKREFLQLDMMLRAQNKNGINQMICTYNPVAPVVNAWLKDEETTIHKDSAFLGVTHKDNPFLQKPERNRIEALADEDEEYDKIYRQGIWATPSFLIYSNWDTILKMPAIYTERIWGLDFGFAANPTALVEIRLIDDKTVAERERIYQTHLTTPELIERLKEAIEDKNEILVADSAQPAMIQEIRNAGFNIFGSHKGAGSVNYGIQTVKGVKTHITQDSENLLKEKQSYKWKQNTNGDPLPDPLKFNDHLLDGERYAITHIKRQTRATVDFVDLGEEKAVSQARYDTEVETPKVYYPPEIDEEDMWQKC